VTVRPFAPIAVTLALVTTGCAGTAARPASASAAIAGIEARLERLRTIRVVVVPLLPADLAGRIERAIGAAEQLLAIARVATDAATRATALDRADRTVAVIEKASRR